MKLKIKKGATVEVIAGAEKGKRGAVLEIDRAKMRIKIQGVRIQTKHDKKEAPLMMSEVMLADIDADGDIDLTVGFQDQARLFENITRTPKKK